jgi:hypothetical protein
MICCNLYMTNFLLLKKHMSVVDLWTVPAVFQVSQVSYFMLETKGETNPTKMCSFRS